MGSSEPSPSSDGRTFQTARGNVHPTCKPLELMSYLITLTTRKGDTVFIRSSALALPLSLLTG